MKKLIVALALLFCAPYAFAQPTNAGTVMCVAGVTSASPQACVVLPSMSATSPFTIGGNAVTASQALVINAASGFSKQLALDAAGIVRIQIILDSTTESGGNAGSCFILRADSDTGTTIDNPISFCRVAGSPLTFSRPIIIPGGTLITTSTALTNGAAAAAGTLLNAPTAGNPTKWIPINDNGTTRYIPTW